MNHEKAFRINLSSIAAREFLDAPWAKNQPDAKAIADICITQAESAISRTVCGFQEHLEAMDKIASLNPELKQHIATAILQASMMIHRNLAEPYQIMKTN